MPRIRSIKPAYFRHEGLQDLEIQYPGKYIMLTFAGLWTLCDSEGRFEWRPRQIKLDILPFLPFDIIDTLNILTASGYIKKYRVSGHDYGLVESFTKHQRITGKEAQSGAIYPDPELAEDDTENPLGNNGETPEKHPDVTQMSRKEEMERGMERGMPICSLEESKEKPKKPKTKKSIQYDSVFLSFYEFYPKKVGKDEAHKAWKKLGLNNGEGEELTTALKRQITYHNHLKDNQKRDPKTFVPEWPYPATWINGRRWEDDVPTVVISEAAPAAQKSPWVRCPRCGKEVLESYLDGEGCFKCQ